MALAPVQDVSIVPVILVQVHYNVVVTIVLYVGTFVTSG